MIPELILTLGRRREIILRTQGPTHFHGKAGPKAMNHHEPNWILRLLFAVLILVNGSLGRAQQPEVATEVRAEGYLSLTRPSLIEKIGLTQEQSVVVGAEIRKYQTELRKLYGNFPPGAQDAEGLQIRQRLIDEHSGLRIGTVKKVAETLSSRQREMLAKLQGMYSDHEPVAEQQNASKAAISILETSHATWAGQRRGTVYQLQDYRDGAMQKLSSPSDPETTQKIDLEIGSSGVSVTIDDQRQPMLFWHSEDRVISAVALSPNGKQIATGTGWFPDRSNLKTPGEIRIWDVSSGKLLQKKFLSNDVHALGFRDDETLLVVLSARSGR